LNVSVIVSWDERHSDAINCNCDEIIRRISKG